MLKCIQCSAQLQLMRLNQTLEQFAHCAAIFKEHLAENNLNRENVRREGETEAEM